MANLKKLKNRDDQNISEEGLVVHSEEAIWLDSKVTGNPAEIGLLLNIPTKSMEFYLQKNTAWRKQRFTKACPRIDPLCAAWQRLLGNR